MLYHTIHKAQVSNSRAIMALLLNVAPRTSVFSECRNVFALSTIERMHGCKAYYCVFEAVKMWNCYCHVNCFISDVQIKDISLLKYVDRAKA